MPEPEENLDVPLARRELPDEVRRLREAERVDDAAHRQTAKTRAAAHLAACRAALADLAACHSRVVEVTDLDPLARSRPAAIWLIAGRCLGLLEALLTQIEAGICNEAIVTARSLHESNRLLAVFGDPTEEELLRLWLADEGKLEYPKPGPTRSAVSRFEERLAEAMEAADLQPLPRTEPLSADLYDRMSRAVHNRRSSCLDSYSPGGRIMAYGRHPSAIRRAAYALWADGMAVETVQAVGDALGRFYGPDFYVERIKPLVTGIEAMETDASVDPESIRSASPG